MGDLGKTSLQPYAGHLFRLAGKCIHRVLLLRCASLDELPGHQPQTWLGHVLAVELCRSAPGMDFGLFRLQSTARGACVPTYPGPVLAPHILPDPTPFL